MTAIVRDGRADPARGRPCPRLVAVSDESRLARSDALPRVEALARAGCPAILLRPGAMMSRRFYHFACEALGACRTAGVELWIGDRADVAAAVGADGVQLPAGGLSTVGARRAVGDGVRVGRSVHAADETARAAAEGADHVILGSIHATASHPSIAPGGLDLVVAGRGAAAERLPILGIGGMTPERVPEVIAAGAWGVAAISALWDADDPAAAVAAFHAALERGRRRAVPLTGMSRETAAGIEIAVNGEPRTVEPGATVGDLLAGHGIDPALVVVERNGRVLPREGHGSAVLEAGDRLEIVTFVGGG